MLFPKSLLVTLAPLMAFALVLVGVPHTVFAVAADLPVGSVSVRGPVQLRGVAVSTEGSLFSGDRIRTQEAAYARVVLADGPQVELGSDTDVTFDVEDDAVRIAMNSGLLAFSSPTAPMNINIASHEIVASQGSKGTVALLENNQLGVHAWEGSLSVRDLRSGELFELSENLPPQQDGQIIILGEETGDDGGGLSAAVWGAIIGGGIGAVVAVVLATRQSTPTRASPN